MKSFKRRWIQWMEKIKAIKPAHKIGAGIITAALVAGVVLPSWNQSIPIQAEGETPNTTVDLSTANNYNAMLGDPDQGGRYAGRVWADKSVFNKPFPSNLGNEKTKTNPSWWNFQRLEAAVSSIRISRSRLTSCSCWIFRGR